MHSRPGHSSARAGVRPPDWWREAVLYQIYPRSFADSDGDGIGDISGIAGRLDYLSWLGIDGVILNPTFPSPNADWGYDVSDYTGVHPDLGSLEDLDRLITEADARGIAVLLDLVANHTSAEHPWFQSSRASRDSPMRDWYVWADGPSDGKPPNNWITSLDWGPAWTFDDHSGQWYLHNFLPTQPDLNWWNENVRRAFDDIIGFWLDRGVAGFRIDTADGIVKDRELRDNPGALPTDPPLWVKRRQRYQYNAHRPEVHDILRRWRSIVDAHKPAGLLYGELGQMSMEAYAGYFGKRDELHLAMSAEFVSAAFTAQALGGVVRDVEAALPAEAWPTWMASNHDISRFPSRWCDGSPEKVACALLALLTLRGTPLLYYGDEIGMVDTRIPPERVRDVTHGSRVETGRDRSRTPMQWSPEPGAGFTKPGVEAWLPLGDYADDNVVIQRDDANSPLNLCRRLIALRRSNEDLRSGRYEQVATTHPDLWAWRRGRRAVVALNLGTDEIRMPDIGRGTVLIDTGRIGEHTFSGELPLTPWRGVVLELSA